MPNFDIFDGLYLKQMEIVLDENCRNNDHIVGVHFVHFFTTPKFMHYLCTLINHSTSTHCTLSWFFCVWPFHHHWPSPHPLVPFPSLLCWVPWLVWQYMNIDSMIYMLWIFISISIVCLIAYSCFFIMLIWRTKWIFISCWFSKWVN